MKKDLKMFFGLLFWSLVPSICTLLQTRLFHTNSLDINILGQLEWFDLIDEILVTINARKAHGFNRGMDSAPFF